MCHSCIRALSIPICWLPPCPWMGFGTSTSLPIQAFLWLYGFKITHLPLLKESFFVPGVHFYYRIAVFHLSCPYPRLYKTQTLQGFPTWWPLHATGGWSFRTILKSHLLFVGAKDFLLCKRPHSSFQRPLLGTPPLRQPWDVCSSRAVSFCDQQTQPALFTPSFSTAPASELILLLLIPTHTTLLFVPLYFSVLHPIHLTNIPVLSWIACTSQLCAVYKSH